MYGNLTNEKIVEWVVCLEVDGVYMFQRGQIWSNCFNENPICTLPHYNSLYGILNKPYNAKFVFHVDGVQIGGFPSVTLQVFL